MQVVLVAAAGLACVLAVALLVWHLSDVPAPDPARQPQPESPPGTGACGCTDVECPVCRGGQRWRNRCHAACAGVSDLEALPCPNRGPCPWPAEDKDGSCTTAMEFAPVCFDDFDPPFVAPGGSCQLFTHGFDERRSRECTSDELRAFQRSHTSG